jgi:hypothetical protein
MEGGEGTECVSRTSNRTATNERETKIPDPEFVPKVKLKQFATEYKLRIIEEADVCT